MSKFRQFQASLAAAEKQAEAVLLQVAEAELPKAPKEQGEKLQGLVEEVLDNLKDGVWPESQKLLAKACPENPEDRMYGEAMTKNIIESAERASGLLERLESANAELTELFGSQAQKESLRRKREQAEEELRKVEEAEAVNRRRAQELAELHEATRQRESRIAELEQAEAAAKEAEEERLRAERKAYEERVALVEECEGLAKKGQLRQILERAKRANPLPQYRRLLEVLRSISRNLKSEFSDPRFRHVRKENETIRASILNSVTGEQCMRAMGFVDKQLQNPVPGAYFVLPEPDLVSDPEGYVFQLERFHGHHDIIEDAASNSGLP